MMLFRFTFRRLLRHWRINLLVCIGMVLTGALVAGLPAYAQAIAAESLAYSIEIEPAFSRNIVLTAGPDVRSFNAALNRVLTDSLGFMVTGQLEVREAEYSAYRSPDGTPDPEGISAPVRLWSFSNLSETTFTVDGRLPNHTEPLSGPAALIEPQPVEAAVGRATAEDGGLEVGDVLFDPGNAFRFEIVGVLEPLDPGDERWFDDPRPFELEIELGLNEDVVTVPLLLNTASMTAFFGGERSWRVIVDHNQIQPATAGRIRAGIEQAQTHFATYGVDLTSGIPLLLNTYETQVQITRVALLLLTAQALIFVFYTLGMITSFMLDRSRTEIASLTSRGARRSQMVGLFTLEGFFIAFLGAAVLGPPLAGTAVGQWVRLTGVQIETGLPADAWGLSIAAGAIGWISFIMPGVALIGRGIVQHQQARARPPQKSAWQARNLDVFLLVVSILAYWQLSTRGSFVMRRLGDSAFADPLLLIGPSLLLIAAALLFLRAFPWVLRVIRKTLSQGRGLILPIGLARLSRDPVGAARVILLISLAAGLTIFSIVFRDSLSARQTEIAHYLSGADLRASTRRTPLDEILQAGGIQAHTTVYRLRVQGPKGNFITLLVVDPATFDKVARYPTGIGAGVPMPNLMLVLGREPEGTAVPGVFSRSALPADAGLENQVNLQIVRQGATVEVRGIIHDFPTLEGDFLVLNRRDVENLPQLAAVNLAQEEAWLALAPGAAPAVRDLLPRQDEILADADALLTRFRTDPLAEGGKSAFALNAAIMGVLSIAGFFIVHFFTAQERGLEFSILRAGGLTHLQLLFMLVVEGLIVMVLGLGSGALVGMGMAYVMRPFLSRIFAGALSGAVVETLMVDWTAIGRIFGTLGAFYTLALLVSVVILMRMGVHRMLRTSVE